MAYGLPTYVRIYNAGGPIEDCGYFQEEVYQEEEKVTQWHKQ